MKIGLVSPYVYPLPGGVTQHVRYLYENLRLRGHDVRIITSSHGLQRSSEGDVIRIGKGFSVPANGSMGTLTVSLRYASLVREVLDQERFDVLHFHEPLVPFLSPLVLRESRSVNVATFHAYAGYSPPYELGSRATTRSSRTAWTSTASPGPCRSPAGRTTFPTCCSSAGSSPARVCWSC
jgi:phosphatidylinositol alpha-mannosyltransferase